LDASVNTIENPKAAIGARFDAFAREYSAAQMNPELTLAVGKCLAQCSDILDVSH
jgi:hypothetical protein